MKKQTDLQVKTNAFYLNPLELYLEQVGYWITVIILLLALIGLFGYGLHGESVVSSSNSQLKVSYDKFLHKEDNDTLEIFIEKNQASNNLIKLSINQDYLNKINLRYITPQPLYSELASNNINFYFRSSNEIGPFKIMLSFEPHAWGKVKARISTTNEDYLQFWQYIYP